MSKKSLDLTKLLPRRYLDKTLETLFKSTFNRHLSKEDTVPIFGYVGDVADLQPGEVKIEEQQLERQINQLTPIIRAEHASEEKLYSWPDLLQKLVLMGVDYKTIKDWFQTKSYNFAPPIDLDMFCNFNEYFWIGAWIAADDTLPYEELGIPEASVHVVPVFESYGNTTLQPEYYVIDRSALSGTTPVAPYAPLTTWSDWALTNLWVHREDVITFLNDHGGTIGFGDLVQATRPIISYFSTMKLNTVQNADGVPAESGVSVGQSKRSINQLPLFDLYDQRGDHNSSTSAVFFYEEGSEYPLDSVIGRRLAVDANNDFLFGQSLVNDDGSFSFFKLWSSSQSKWILRTIWREGEVVAPRYVKYDLTGTLINQDKFNNFKNYYWLGSTKTPAELPTYNEAGDPEYYVIEQGGTSGWSVYNFWVHVSNLKRSELYKYAQATRPIIEFNLKLESQLVQAKTKEGEVPQFKHYYQDSSGDHHLISEDTPITDAYAQKALLARIDDLPVYVKSAILNSPEILANCFVHDNEYYIQGLFNGKFIPEQTDEAGLDYLYCPPTQYNYASTPYSVVNATGGEDLDVRVRVSTSTWATLQQVISRWGAAGNRGWQLALSAGAIVFKWSPDGTAINTRTSGVHGFQVNEDHWIRVTLNGNNGSGQHVVTFYTSTNGSATAPNWVQLSQVVTAGTSSVFDSTAPIELSDNPSSGAPGFVGLLTGRIYVASVRKVINGSTRVSMFNPNDSAFTGETSFVSYLGEIWTINQAGADPAELRIDGSYTRYLAKKVEYDGEGNGVLGTIAVGYNCIPEVLTLTYRTLTGKFDVVGSVTGSRTSLTVGTKYSASGITFTINAGSTPFAEGDLFVIEIKSLQYQQQNAYVLLDGVYRTLEEPSQIKSEVENSLVVESDPSLQDGVWEVPPQIMWNVMNETRSQVKQGDLYYHMISIIKSQSGFTGSETGANNWRSLTTNYGKGGVIKQYDGDAFLFISMMIQEGITVPALLEFAREQYDSLFTTIRTFVQDRIPLMLTETVFTPPTDLTLDPKVIEEFKAYFSGTSQVVTSSASKVDDFISTVFYDSTSSLKNLVATLPYLGLSQKVQPKIDLDLELNMSMITHHDGHKTKLPTVTDEFLRRIVNMKFKRSGGQESTGTFTGVDYPERPHRGQFWFKMTEGKLYYYNVISDRKEFKTFVPVGTYSYDREDDQIYVYDGGSWLLDSSPGAKYAPWTEVDFARIEQNLILAIENELYEKCPSLSLRVDAAELELNQRFDPLMQKELERFGIKYGIGDVYSSTFDPENPFTWNYSGIIALGAVAEHATWQEIYRDLYGTPRPDLEPWITCGFATETAFIDHLVTLAILPMGTTEFDSTTMWPAIEAFVKSRLNLFSKPQNLSVDVATGALIAPYQFDHAEAIMVVPPPNASQVFEYGDLGPIELFWTRTTNYLYAKQKSYFKINPISYLSNTWGSKSRDVDGYVLDVQAGRKLNPSDLTLHGEDLDTLISSSWIEVFSSGSNPSTEQIYTLTCISRLDDLFRLEGGALGDTTVIINTSDTYSDAYLTLGFTPELREFFWGDSFKITVSTTGAITVVATAQQKFISEGLNQIYSQYNRSFGEDPELSINKSLLRNWSLKLAYRFGGLVNTDSLMIRNASNSIIEESFNVRLKENRFYKSFWVNALRVQLVQRGATERVNGSLVPATGSGGTPAEDWIWRVDIFNPVKPELTWYTYDTSVYHNFFALEGKKSSFSWKRPTKATGVMTLAAPFLITGLQNVVNFLFGYADYLEAQGWRFNDQENPVLDQDTKRPVNYQLIIEKFIDQQFGGVEAGSAFIANPFSRKVWFVTPRGVVSDLGANLGFEQETVCTVLDSSQKKIPISKIRVFRQDEITQLVFDQPVHALHLLLSEYEHVVLFDDYSAETLVYDQFLGQRAAYLFISGAKQRIFSGRLDFGGHFLIGNEMKKNIESSVESIIKMYDSNSDGSASEVEQARKLLGYSKKSYFEDRNTPDQTEFRFWQGMIKNKGTNFSVDAFLNSAKYKTAKLDEYWAYKVAEYGDFRAITRPELRVQPEDCFTEMSAFFFNEERPQTFSIETVDQTGTISISPIDDQRWASYSDLRVRQYFDAEVIATKLMTFTSIEDVYEITDARGKPVRADCYEIVDPSFIIGADGYDMAGYDAAPWDAPGHERYFEHGEYVTGTNPPEFSAPKFKRLNHSTIQILSNTLLGRQLLVVAYGPSVKKYNPTQLYDYVNNTLVKDDGIMWDPARGIHHPEAIREVDYAQDEDPAHYNVMSQNNTRSDVLRPWGESQVGKIWWNQTNLFWTPYSDEKIHPEFRSRVARWGGVSPVSTIDVLEWVKSDVPPTEYQSDDGSTLGLQFLLNRTRTWWHRPVAWKYSENPALTTRTFLAYQPQKLKLSITNGRGTVILKSGSLATAGVTEGCKIAGATYTSNVTKNHTTLSKIFGTAKVISSESIVLGTAAGYDDGASFAASVYATMSIKVDPEIMSFRTSYLGQYVLSSEVDTDTYLRLTHVSSGASQRLKMVDSPVTANTKDSYVFDQLGLTLEYTALFGHADAWPTLGVISAGTRITTLAAALGNAGHQIYLRSSAEVFSPLAFNNGVSTLTELPAQADSTVTGWIVWRDPDTNPYTSEVHPFNKYEPIVGDWVEVGNFLPDLASEITTRMSDPWLFFDGLSYNPYKSTWSDWTRRRATLRSAYYNTKTGVTHAQFFRNNFTYGTLTKLQLEERASLYVNEVKQPASAWSVALNNSNQPYVLFTDSTQLKKGDVIRVRLVVEKISDDLLKFDPETDDNPLILTQYKRETPYVVDEVRDPVNDAVIKKNYYFWVKDKAMPAPEKKMSTVKIEQLLTEHDDFYVIHQAFRFYNQVDGRPNRYGILVTRDLGRYVGVKDTYKLRLTCNPTLRNDDQDLDLKNVHTEWKLIRPYQAERIPKQLWDALTNTLIGQTELNEELPSSALKVFDQRNSTTQRFGLGAGQIMADPEVAKATVKYTVLNTKVDKYLNDQLEVDYISYPGFDLNLLDDYLASPESIRKFMTDLWRFASPKQINEIFFAVLEDSAAVNLEMSDLFKTSFISLDDVRTINNTI